jgi:ribosomal protein S18 acetylase RimI-like enzyme
MYHSSTISIRSMQPGDLAFAASCTAAEGWVSEDRPTLEGFYLKDSHGCLLAEKDGQPVGICIATCYANSGFIGELIVLPEQRGRGVGSALLNRGVSILKDRGVEAIYLDGVLNAVELYERNGFRKVCRSWRFSGNLAGYECPGVRRMQPGDLDQVSKLDQAFFGDDRGFFLRRRLDYFPELSYILLEDGRISGYILGRRGKEWLTAGPWVVNVKKGSPADLLNTFALQSEGKPISIGILDSNHLACELAHSLGFKASPESPWRMALGKYSSLGSSLQCYAVGSAAKG